MAAADFPATVADRHSRREPRWLGLSRATSCSLQLQLQLQRLLPPSVTITGPKRTLDIARCRWTLHAAAVGLPFRPRRCFRAARPPLLSNHGRYSASLLSPVSCLAVRSITRSHIRHGRIYSLPSSPSAASLLSAIAIAARGCYFHGQAQPSPSLDLALSLASSLSHSRNLSFSQLLCISFSLSALFHCHFKFERLGSFEASSHTEALICIYT